jgi:hypothetical protein
MMRAMLTKGATDATVPFMGRGIGWIGLLAAGVALSGCITLEAPDKPIEINLNINIKQEVVYRLDGEAKNLIQQEADIF